MRTIKFRAWDKDANCMAYSENEDDYWWEINPLKCGYIAGELSGDQSEPPSPILGYCDNIMQFTGLQDKSSKDIYEGDIIDCGLERYYPVIFKDGVFCLKELEGMSWLLPMHKIAGNIHENPELLK